MNKYLGMVDPLDRITWFGLVTSKIVKEKGFELDLGKLHHLHILELETNLKCKILGYCVSSKEMRGPNGDPNSQPYAMWPLEPHSPNKICLDGLQFLSFIPIHCIHASVQDPLVIESELKWAHGQGRNVDYEKRISEKRGLIEKAKTYSRSANSGMWWDTFFED